MARSRLPRADDPRTWRWSRSSYVRRRTGPRVDGARSRCPGSGAARTRPSSSSGVRRARRLSSCGASRPRDMSVGNHSYSHRHPWTIRETEARDEVRDGAAAIADALGHAPRWFRPPHGRMRRCMLDEAERSGQRTVLWSLSAIDWGPLGHAAGIAARVRGVGPGDIVLMHDGRNRHNRPDELSASAAAATCGTERTTPELDCAGRLRPGLAFVWPSSSRRFSASAHVPAIGRPGSAPKRSAGATISRASNCASRTYQVSMAKRMEAWEWPLTTLLARGGKS